MIVAVSLDSEIVTAVPLVRLALLMLKVNALLVLSSPSSVTGTEIVAVIDPAVIVPDPDVDV